MPETTTEPAKETTTAAAGATTTPAAGTTTPGAGAPQQPVPAPAGTAKETTTATPAAGEGKKASFAEAAAETDGQPKGSAEGDKKDAPAELNLKLPEGVKVDEPLFTGFKAVAQEAKLSQDQAQAVLDTYAKAVAEQGKKAQSDWEARLAENRKALESHPQIGGTNLEKSQADARKAVLTLDRTAGGLGTKLVQKLAGLGLGDDPDVAHLLVLVGRSMAEDSTGTRTPTGNPSMTPEQARLAKRYPSIQGIQPGNQGES